ncbi:ABC transporter permease [Fulvivirga ulvae]|uniref:ABC transporter permease n=1 Tax=Fulvivirga ulvae TaxID=2904245 RepID=UPI001F304AEF|nr:ABC transporter permease [Fulvivirga ulvae]UII33785.1 ABC transporter permease [Fulvivirga ulvae]
MIYNYLKILLRITRRQHFFAIINSLGLSVGMAVFILIMLWVNHEVSFDGFHKNAGDIYRVNTVWKKTGEKSASTPGKLAEAIKTSIPEVELVARLHSSSDQSFYTYGDKSFYENKIAYVDPAFFQMFDFPAIKGGASNWLEPSGSMVISETIARKYFGSENPINKVLTWNNRTDNIVTGVVADFPDNSHLQFNFIYSHNDLQRYWPGGYSWTNFVHNTYLQLKPGADIEAVNKKLTALLFNNTPASREEVHEIYLQPLEDIYLDPKVSSSVAKQGNRQYVNIFSIVALAILAIACINFINLSTARAGKRAREVGVRKSLGASRKSLIIQFFSESLGMAFISFLVSMLLVEIFLPAFNQLVQKNIDIDYGNWRFLGGLAVMVFLTGIISGIYPALLLSSFKTTSVLKGAPVKEGHSRLFRKGLVVIQFTVSMLLIIGSTVIFKQLYFLQNKQLGFSKENTIYIPAQGNITSKYEMVRQELLQSPHIADVTARESLPMVSINTNYITWPGKESDLNYSVETIAVDYNFMETMGVKFSDGRNFSAEHATDADRAFIVNQSAVEMMELKEPVGTEVSTRGREGEIIGVIPDVNFKSLHQPVQPQLFYVLKDFQSMTMQLFGVVLIKIAGNDPSAAIEDIQKVAKKYNPDIPFEYHFLDQEIDAQYAFEERLSKVSNYFSGLAIVVSCLGLLGLVTYTTQQREKELGIRKVLGASPAHLLRNLTGDFLLLILLAWLMAAPLGYYLLHEWLQGFAYKIDLNIATFLGAGAVALLVTLSIIGTQLIRAIHTNPAEVLKCE